MWYRLLLSTLLLLLCETADLRAQSVLLPRLIQMGSGVSRPAFTIHTTGSPERGIRIDLHLSQPQRVWAELLSLQGECLQRWEARLPAGPGRLDRPAGVLPPGLYLLRLYTRQDAFTEKVLMP